MFWLIDVLVVARHQTRQEHATRQVANLFVHAVHTLEDQRYIDARRALQGSAVTDSPCRYHHYGLLSA